ncbi:MAG: DUF4367 domain-containing protein [Lachnospiraceae bacterium]|nr:DUF4367 domain-containing protein [Lachnospiraceae bacterium]
MKACDEKLKSSILEAIELDDARLEEELKSCEPHVFSEKFEREMEALFERYRRKKRLKRIQRYAMAAAVVLLLTGGIFYLGSGDLRATKTNIDILEWFENFFTVKDGTDDRSGTKVLFEESQIGYLPEGFEKVGEDSSFSAVQYKYVSDNNKYIVIQASKGKLSFNADGKISDQEVCLNEKGYEYTMTQKNELGEVTLMWKDAENIYYYVTGTLEIKELIAIMDGIYY